MGWQFWRKKQRETAQAAEPTGPSLEERLASFERKLDSQRFMIDERTRVMADALSTELRALGRIMADLSKNMGDLNAQVLSQLEAKAEPLIEELPAPLAAPQQVARISPPPARLEVRERPLTPPPPANDPPAPLKHTVDPMLLDALAKGRVAFDLTKITAIPPRGPMLGLMRFAPPLPEIDCNTLDTLADAFPDAALLLDRLMMDAAASMIRAAQVPSTLPLLVPLSPVTPRDAVHAADFRRRFERLNHAGGALPLFSETGWIALAEAGQSRMEELAGSRPNFAIRVSGHRRVDPSALGRLGVRYVLAAYDILAINNEHPLAPDIHPSDIARLFARAGIGIVAENVPDQVTVLGLLRNNITMGWGPALQQEAVIAPSAEVAEEPPQLDFRAYLRRAGS